MNYVDTSPAMTDTGQCQTVLAKWVLRADNQVLHNSLFVL
ncbi:hypothetical protein RRG08_057404 [Elysia crispata]|uniref:Uncharacterized protein n=1 Tax=Elysia crispata TaxID=231223 RepID=A0AAE1B2Y6_9GAST|nr:hypothetical protein RRG08_057404 [Elysia crispata]